MFHVSAAVLWHKSKRIVVKLLSAAQTGFYYVTEKSPSKRDVRMALRKHDPIVNQHVIFYEQKNLSSSQAQKLMRKRSVRNMRFTGKRVEQLVKQEEKRSNRSIAASIMLDYFFPFSSIHHDPSIFQGETVPLVKSLGLDNASSGPCVPIHGPIEYVFKIHVSPPLKNGDGAIAETGTRTTPLLAFIGKAGQSEMIPIKTGFKSGSLAEFSATAKDVGQVTALKLADPFAKTESWHPKVIEVNRLGASNGKEIASQSDGWVSFEVNRSVKEPIIVNSNAEANIKKQ